MSIIPIWRCPECGHEMRDVVVGPAGKSAAISEVRCEKCSRVSALKPDPMARIFSLVIAFHTFSRSIPGGHRIESLQEVFDWFKKSGNDAPRAKLAQLREGLSQLTNERLGVEGRELLDALDDYLDNSK
jgi:hypothetical protein